MKRLQLLFGSAVLGSAIVLVALTAGCGDESTEPVSTEGGVLITPEIRIAGLEQLDDGVYLEDLYLGIGEIRLEPVGDPTEAVYVTREPLFLHFNLDAGQWSLAGPPMLLPRGGEYLVSLRMDAVDDGSGERSSMRVDGLMADIKQDRAFLDANSIEPTPLPMRTAQGGLSGRTNTSVTWVPWTYITSRTVNVVLNNVEFTRDQTLVVNFDVAAWLVEVIEPISAEVIANTDESAVSGETSWPVGPSAVDVSKTVDACEGGLELLGAWSEAFSG